MNAQELIESREPQDKDTLRGFFYPKAIEGLDLEQEELKKIREAGLKHNAEVRQRIKQKEIPTAEEILEEL